MTKAAMAREDRFERFIAVLIALTTIFTSIAAFLEHLSSNESERFDRTAQELSIEATTTQLDGALRFSSEWQGAFQNWYELGLMGTNAEQLGYNERADVYRAAQQKMLELSPLLQEPYFDPAAGWTDSGQFIADLYLVEAVRLREFAEDKAAVSNTWDQIANYFVLQLTFYAVALSLLGLSTTLHSFIRWLFVGMASLIVLFNIAWGALLFFAPVEEISVDAVNAYADGVGLAYQGRDEEAVRAFTRALEIHPAYVNAMYDRGYSRLILGDRAGAAIDFEAALSAGRRDTSLLWNLGWTYYLLGRFEDAVAVNQEALNMDPSLIGIRMNQGLTMLAQGRVANAAEEYRLAMQEATRQVQQARESGASPPVSLWLYMDAGVRDLEGLLDTIHGTPRPWTEAPDPSSIQGDPASIEDEAQKQIRTIKEYAVALEYSGTIPQATTNASVSEFAFVQERYDENGNFLEYVDSTVNAYGTNQIGILFDYANIEIGQHEVWKIYQNGVEDTALRVDDTWEVPASSSAAIKWISYAYSNVYVFSPGEYTVELYIDSKLLGRGTFQVLQP